MPKRTTRHTVRTLRLQRGFSQIELGRLSGLDQPFISKIELGKIGDPAFTKGLKLADALGVDPHVLKFGDDDAVFA